MLRGEVNKKYLRQIVGHYKRTNTKSRLTKIYYVGLKKMQGKQKLTLVRKQKHIWLDAGNIKVNNHKGR